MGEGDVEMHAANGFLSHLTHGNNNGVNWYESMRRQEWMFGSVLLRSLFVFSHENRWFILVRRRVKLDPADVKRN